MVLKNLREMSSSGNLFTSGEGGGRVGGSVWVGEDVEF